MGAALTSIASCAPTESDLVRRKDDNLGIHEPSKVWKHYAAFCPPVSTIKRDLEERAPKLPPGHTQVTQGKSAAYNDLPIGLWTEHLITCIGVGLIGKTKEGNKDVRVLGHFQASEGFLKSEWDAFEKLVDDAKLDKDSTKGFLSIPDLHNQLPTVPFAWTDDDAKLGKKIADKLEEKLNGKVKGKAKVVTRPMLPAQQGTSDTAGTMSINPDNICYIEGNPQN